MKPMLAEDWDEAQAQKHFTSGGKFLAQPKFDGVRGVNLTGTLTGRSKKPLGNVFTTRFFSHSALVGFDGELVQGCETDSDVCRRTTSAVSTHTGEPYVVWNIFDVIQPSLPYTERWNLANARLYRLAENSATAHIAQRMKLVPTFEVSSMQTLGALDEHWLSMGYEGTIIRRPDGLYKYGRSTVLEGKLLRIKRFIEEDALVDAIEEGSTNNNEALTNALGYTERSSHADHMTPNGMVGNLRCRLLKDVFYRGELLFRAGAKITVGAGSMPHDLRRRYFEHPHLIVGETIKFKTFPKGVKDKPRFPTFQSIRADADKEAP